MERKPFPSSFTGKYCFTECLSLPSVSLSHTNHYCHCLEVRVGRGGKVGGATGGGVQGRVQGIGSGGFEEMKILLTAKINALRDF